MQEYYENIIEELQEEIRELTMEVDDPIRLSEQAVKISWDKLQQVKAYVLSHTFANSEDEIWFFKNIKPRILSYLIYKNSFLFDLQQFDSTYRDKEAKRWRKDYPKIL